MSSPPEDRILVPYGCELPETFATTYHYDDLELNLLLTVVIR